MNKCACGLCGGKLLQLPIPSIDRALLSDGRLVEVPLEKASCLSCGMASQVRHLSEAAVRGVYGEEYSLATASPSSDRSRARSYVEVLKKLITPVKRVLEIGCGSGALLRELQAHWPTTALVGIDPAAPNLSSDSERIRFERGFFETYSNEEGSFDLIISVNVIEHVAAPKDFFSRAAALLPAHGQLAIFCPASSPPNVELLFQDHLHTFTSGALASLARSAGLSVVKQIDRVDALGDFQFMLLARSDAETAGDISLFMSEDEAVLLSVQRAQYMRAWGDLETTLLSRTTFASRIALFGAGQMAALLRTYAPRIWNRVDLIVVDNVNDAWSFEKPVSNYAESIADLADAAVLIATAPGSQAYVAERLDSDGINAVRFDDVIRC